MAVLMTANDEANMTFHDFLGISPEASAAVVAKDSAGLGDGDDRTTEGSASAFTGAPPCARRPVSSSSDIASAQTSNRFSGRKRSNADSGFIGLARDRMHMMGVDSDESSRLVKMFQNEMAEDQGRSNRDKRSSFSMQPPKRTSTPMILQQPSMPKLVVSDQERSLTMNAGPLVHHPSHFGESPPYVDKTSLKKYSDIPLAGPSTCIPTAADEGSRTGMKDSSILHAIGVSSTVSQRNATGPLPSSSRANVVHLNSGTESANLLRRCFLTSPSQQMTIFYAGQAHVFDDVHPNKADEIMTLARSSGGSWSTTTYSPTSSSQQPSSEAYAPFRENEASINKLTFSHDMRSWLTSFQSSFQGASQGKHPSAPGDPQNL